MNTNKRLKGDEEEAQQDMPNKRHLQSLPSSEFGSPPPPPPPPPQGLDDCNFDQLLMEKWLWCLGHNWSSLLKHCDSSSSIDSTLDLELASLCHWFLSTEAPEPFKEGAIRVLKLISSQATEMSIDQQSVYYSLERVLDSKNEELLQQACSAIAFLSWCCSFNSVKDLYLDDGVVNKLFNLVDHNSPVQAHARLAICSIAFADKNVKEEISKKAFPEWPFQYGDTLKAEHACVTVACIVGGNKDDATWGNIEGVLIPPMVKVLTGDIDYSLNVVIAAAYAISRATSGATHTQIEKLFEMGCLNALCDYILVPKPLLVSHCLDGIECILRAGAEQGNNKYFQWIKDNELSPSWWAFYTAGLIYGSRLKRGFENKAFRIAVNYALEHCEWVRRFFPREDLPDYDENDFFSF